MPSFLSRKLAFGDGVAEIADVVHGVVEFLDHAVIGSVVVPGVELKFADGVGAGGIKKELVAKGFDEDVIRKVLGELDTDFSDICARRIARMGGIECFSDRLSRQKIVASLIRYGFSYEDIREAIQKLSEKE